MSEEKRADNLSMRIWLQTLESIVGPDGLKSILNYSHLEKYIGTLPPPNDEMEIPAEDFSILLLSLSELFGYKGTRALKLRAGREYVRLGVKESGRIAKALQVATRLLPEPKRMRLALEKFAEETEKRLSSSGGPLIEVKEDDHYFFFTHTANPESEGVVSQAPVCGVCTGLLQALMEWITGHPHEVEEIECKAMGHPADVFRISKLKTE